MENSSAKTLVCALLAAIVCAPLGAQDAARSDDLVLDFDSGTFNRQTNLFEARRPRIVQGNMHIEADESSGVDVEQSSEWRFKGHVKITVNTAVLEADSAVFMFDGKQLTHAELQGNPASFTELEATRQKPVRGGARKLTYDHVARTLRLSDNALVKKDQIEIQGCDLIYDFKAERVSSGSTDCGDQLFRIVVPKKSEQQAPAAAPPQ
ncbi:MAG: LptA/OstA family protein [Gammaproteobacteria bacterium]